MKTYAINPQCLIDGHLMDDGSLPTCMRTGCDEGMQIVDYYSELEDRECRCVGDDDSRCGWHNERFHSMEGVETYYKLLAKEEEKMARRQSHRRPLADRLWEKVNKNGPVQPHCSELGPCWEWTASTSNGGYGQIRVARGDQGWTYRPAHVVAWELINGAMPEDKKGLHHCDNPPCVRPSHIFPGTQLTNIEDMDAKGRRVSLCRPGESNPNARLTEIEATEILRRLQRGETTTALALAFHVSQSTVSHIKTGKKWPHLKRIV
jgi:hypothetical protein